MHKLLPLALSVMLTACAVGPDYLAPEPVPLAGFTKAYDGGPIDTKKYQQARQKLMQLIQKRHLALAKKAAAARKKKEAEKKAATPPAKPK